VNAMNDANANANLNCRDRDRVFEDGSPAEWAALEAHAVSCPECAGEIRAWKSLSVAATELRDYSDDLSLWPRIHRSLVEEAAKMEQSKSRWSWESIRQSFSLSWQTATAAGVVLLLVVSAAVYQRRNMVVTKTPPAAPSGDLLRNNALAQVERTQSDYMHAIDKLASDAKPQLDNPETPLLANYREKLQVLDSAIDDLRAQAGQNPSNAHLRYQLLAMYQEKQRTLEEVLEVKR
jgi:anti-sigma factor RsiW